jgi:hypothetical protein
MVDFEQRLRKCLSEKGLFRKELFTFLVRGQLGDLSDATGLSLLQPPFLLHR